MTLWILQKLWRRFINSFFTTWSNAASRCTDSLTFSTSSKSSKCREKTSLLQKKLGVWREIIQTCDICSMDSTIFGLWIINCELRSPSCALPYLTSTVQCTRQVLRFCRLIVCKVNWRDKQIHPVQRWPLQIHKIIFKYTKSLLDRNRFWAVCANHWGR